MQASSIPQAASDNTPQYHTNTGPLHHSQTPTYIPITSHNSFLASKRHFMITPFGWAMEQSGHPAPGVQGMLCTFKTLGTNTTTWLLLQFPLHPCSTHSHHKQVPLAGIC